MDANHPAKRKQNGSKPTGKNPSFPFYPGDWMKDPELRSVSAEARGLWIDLLCLMWEAPRRGHLVAGSGMPFRAEHISRMTGVPEGRVIELLAEMEEVGLFSRDSETEAIFNRRMARQGEISQARAQAGSKGGSNSPSKTEANTEAKEKLNRLPSSSSSSSSSSSEKRSTPLPPKGEGGTSPPRARFQKPSIEEVCGYFVERGVEDVQASIKASAFVDHYEANGWMVGRVKMRDWRGAVRNWIRNDQNYNGTRNGHTRAEVKPVRGQGF